jgi:two-component system, chemotaxis family, chemotaxis protein CheY
VKALIVDDALVMRNIHKNILKEKGFRENDLFAAADGAEAFVIATKHQIGLFLIDWNMPRMNGFDFVKKIRTMEGYKDTPIIMITAEAAKYNVMEAIEAGVTNYVVKPVKADILWEKIKKYIQ